MICCFLLISILFGRKGGFTLRRGIIIHCGMKKVGCRCDK